MTGLRTTLDKIKRGLRAGSERRDARLTHPSRDWSVALVSCLCLFLASCAGAGYLFWQKSTRVSEAENAPPSGVVYDQRIVGKVLEEYRARKARYETLHGILPNEFETENATSTNATATSTEPVAE
jgi:hypothetical protein